MASPREPDNATSSWRLPFGATVVANGVEFAVWAPKARSVSVEVTRPDGTAGSVYPLGPDSNNRFSATVPGIGAGTRYRFRLDDAASYPDPYSRFQPEGPHGPSEVVDPPSFRWRTTEWPGIAPDDLVIYECHVGTMTAEGTFAALARELPELARLGVTAIELMPLAEFPGRWNWGYDGVDLFAPSHTYGRPDDLKRLIDDAHQLGLAVLLDVVYNHFGPDGNYLRAFSDDYFTDRHRTPWGEAINYDGTNSRFVRDLAIHNACYWLAEYRFDGLRLDATHAILDDSEPHLLSELAGRARAAVAPRPIVVIAEDDRNEVRIVNRREDGGFGLDGIWADDFHHAVRVSLTGVRGGYLDNYRGTTEEIAQTVNAAVLYQGQPEPVTGRPRGTLVADQPASAFVYCIQNHDQVGNRAFGERLHHEIDLERYKVASALLLFLPYTPLLFMGQEFAASSSFMFFTDHNPELGKLVTEGRREEFKGFAAFSDPEVRESIPDPQDPETFLRSKLNLVERALHAPIYTFYRELLRLRREDPVLRHNDRLQLRAESIGARVLAVHRWREGEYRLLLANFGPSIGIRPPKPPSSFEDVPARASKLILTTSETRFGGDGPPCGFVGGQAPPTIELPARSAAIFAGRHE